MPGGSDKVTAIGSFVLAGMVIAAVTLLAAFKVIDGATTVATIMAALGVSGGISATVRTASIARANDNTPAPLRRSTDV